MERLSTRPLNLVSIHASHAGGDFNNLVNTERKEKFQSTPPMREATGLLTLSTYRLSVSIYASHAGGDDLNHAVSQSPKEVSIHASHAGGD